MTEPLCCPRCWDSNIIGIEMRGVYDGVLIWECGACDHRWPRFTEGVLHRLGREHLYQRDDHR